MSEKVKKEKAQENTQEMQPKPETMVYEDKIKLTDLFEKDVIDALGNYSYAETNEIITFIKNNKEGAPVNLVNQVINRLSSFPWKSVNGVMYNIKNAQSKYFVLIPKE